MMSSIVQRSHHTTSTPLSLATSPPFHPLTMSDIKVVRLVSTDKPLEVGTASKPKPGPKDVLVKVLACSIVPNTFNLITGKADEHTDGETTFTLAKAPLVFGLDVSGVVEEIGEHVQNIAKGDRVYVNPWLTCDTCQACRTGAFDPTSDSQGEQDFH